MKVHSTVPKYTIDSHTTHKQNNDSPLKHLHVIAPLASISKAKTMYITMSTIIDAFVTAQRKHCMPFIFVTHVSEAVMCLNKNIYIPDDSDFIFIPSRTDSAAPSEKYHFQQTYSGEKYDTLLCCSSLALVALQRCVFNAYFLDCHWNTQLNTILTYYTAYNMHHAIYTSQERMKIQHKAPRLQNFSFSSHPSLSTSGYLHIAPSYTTQDSSTNTERNNNKKKHNTTAIPPIIHSIIPHKHKDLHNTTHTSITAEICTHTHQSLHTLAQSLISSQEQSFLCNAPIKETQYIYSLLLLLEYGGAFYEYKQLHSQLLHAPHRTHCLSFVHTDYTKDTLYNQNSSLSIQQKQFSLLLFFEQTLTEHMHYMFSFKKNTFSPDFFAAYPQAKLTTILLENALQALQQHAHTHKKHIANMLTFNYVQTVLQELFNIDVDTTITMHKELLKEIYTTLQNSPYFAAYIFDVSS